MKITGNGNTYKFNGSGSGTKTRAWNIDEVDFDITSTERQTVTSSSGTSQTTNQDLILTNLTTASGFNYWENQVIQTGFFGGTPILSSSDTNIFTVTQDGITTRIANGTANLIVQNEHLKKSYPLTFSAFGGETTVQSTERATGSLGKECDDSVDTRIVGLTASDTTKKVHDNSQYNSSCWAADIDLTCVSRHKPTATLITPRHAICAEHYKTGNSITFIGSDNSIVTRTVIGRKNVGPSNASDGYATDLHIMTLNADIPETLQFAKVLPSNILDYLPTIRTKHVACLTFDQEKKALITDLYNLTTTRASFIVPIDAQRNNFYEAKISGDSGSPAFLLIDGEPVLVTTWTFGGAGSGPAIHALHTSINTAISASDTNAGVSTGYTVTAKDVSAFTSYA